ncbi:MFS transporter [Curtobacterium flaccumfaciens]|uniref:MFS transporter n=1 Tax=Curtobacterium flaccumfaciens TaxID=2035 RepID=UPI0022082B13|nr:MFS transporter [Curtobacterium flaccumfaciens]UWD84173.1 MFS transporter [Curtobacterium flaccumfaciens]
MSRRNAPEEPSPALPTTVIPESEPTLRLRNAPESPVTTSTATVLEDVTGPVSRKWIWLMVVAQFGVFVAFITPLAISLSIRLQAVAPGHAEYLGYITGAGAGVVVLTGPFLGTMSDRTRTRFGRRRPFMIGGMVLGMVSLFMMATAPSALLLGLGWVLAQLGWGQTLSALQIRTADRLPEQQRGRVAGLTGFATQIAPVLGVSIAGAFAGDALLLFFVPGILGAVLVLFFVVFLPEPDSRRMVLPELRVATVLRKLVFNPRRYPDFAWNWLGRFFFYFGLSLNTTFTAFFFAQRLGITVTEVAGVIAVLSLGGIVTTVVGALGGGFLSDKLKRRRVFVLLSGILFAAGAVTMALSPSLPLLVTGSLISGVGIGMFSAVDQALLLDVLPERDTDAGRFMGITGFATSVPQAVAPLIAPLFLVIGATGGEKNYTLLYLLAGVFTVIGGLLALRVRSVR